MTEPTAYPETIAVASEVIRERQRQNVLKAAENYTRLP